jgi:uncharacterized protein YbjT (DUF2867 family)
MSSAASNTKKNILILGSTGPLGALTTQEALAHHFKITIFVRSPEKLALFHPVRQYERLINRT